MMFPIFALAISTVSVSQEEPDLNYSDLVSAMRQANPITSISYMFEGSANYLALAEDNDKDDKSYDFQGSYAYRISREPEFHRAAYLDLYKRKRDGTLEHETHVTLDDEHVFTMHDPDREPNPDRIFSARATLTSLESTGSPERVTLHRRFDGWQIDNDEFAEYVRIEGWDEIDSHRCLRVVVGPRSGSLRGKSYARYWIDLNRGAHVVQYEHIMQGNLGGKVDQVKLERVAVLEDGRDAWYPVAARYASYTAGIGDFRDSPTVEMTFRVLRETIQVNEELPDSRFDVLYRPGLPENDRLRQLEREFRAQGKEPMDFASIQERLEENLAEANRQSEELEASSLARRTSWANLASPTFLLIGVALVSAAGVIVLRRRA